jgi:hypothetical protein
MKKKSKLSTFILLNINQLNSFFFLFHLNDVHNSRSLRCSYTFSLSDDSIIGVEKLITFCSSIVYLDTHSSTNCFDIFNKMIRNGRLSSKDKIKSSLTSSFFLRSHMQIASKWLECLSLVV